MAMQVEAYCSECGYVDSLPDALADGKCSNCGESFYVPFWKRQEVERNALVNAWCKLGNALFGGEAGSNNAGEE